jgi:hypothetical protein
MDHDVCVLTLHGCRRLSERCFRCGRLVVSAAGQQSPNVMAKA